MVGADASFLGNKKLVYHVGVPVPFAIYEGMLESIYMVNSSVAYTSVCSPGYYKCLREFVRALDSECPLSVVDDILGLCAFPHANDRSVHYSVTTRSIIDHLTALNRIQWACSHVEGPANILDSGIVWVANPLAYMNYLRVGEINAEVVNLHKNTTFILPIGTGEKSSICLQYFANVVKRNFFYGRVPCALIDDSVIIVPAAGVESIPTIAGLHVEPVRRMATGTWSLEQERKVFQHLYG